jgi:hypothetical protein
MIKTSLFVFATITAALTAASVNAAPSVPNIEVLTAQDVAAHVKGCGTLLARTSDYRPRPAKTENWVFFDDWEQAYLRVNGQLVTLTLTDPTPVTHYRPMEGLKTYKVFKSQTPKLTVDLSLITTKVIAGDETDARAFIKGTLKISDGTQTLITPVSGEEGC